MTPRVRLLSDFHREQLVNGSGVSRKVIAARGYFTATDNDLMRLGFKKYQLGSGLVIPQYDPSGANGGYQVRRDRPRKDREGREIKYETPAGSRLHLDVNPLMVKTLGDRSAELLITEGSKKVDAAASHGICGVSVPGVWGWKKDGQPITDWTLIPLKRRPVYIAFDSDVMVKPEVAKALDELSGYLTTLGADVTCIYLPTKPDGSKQGIDDYLLHHPRATLASLAAAKKSTAVNATLQTADEAEPKAIEWWWQYHIPTGKLGLQDGDPGLAKSAILCDLIASATTGRALPDGSKPLRTGGAVLFSAEDGYEDTIVPRLIAAGADLSKVLVAHAADYGRAIALPRDIEALEALITQMNAVLVAFDPWEFYLDADIIKGKEQRVAFESVKRLIADRKVVLIGNRHLNQQSGQKAMYRGRGDITAIGMARWGFIVGPDPHSENQQVERVMVPLKYNLAPRERVHGFRYRVEEVTLKETDGGTRITAPRIQWNGQTDVTGDQVVDSQGAQRVTAKQIMEANVLPLLQQSGPQKSDDCWTIMRAHGINGTGNVSAACKALGIHATKEGMSGPWWWYLDGQLEMVPGQMKVKVEKRSASTNIHPRKAARVKTR